MSIKIQIVSGGDTHKNCSMDIDQYFVNSFQPFLEAVNMCVFEILFWIGRNIYWLLHEWVFKSLKHDKSFLSVISFRPCAFYYETLLINDLISLIDKGPSRLSISPSMNSGSVYLLRNWSKSYTSGYEIEGHRMS